MLGNCEKMVLISSSANQWPQMKNHPTSLDHDHHQKGLNLMGSSSGLIMDKQLAAAQDQKPHQKQQQQEPLRCPRCDSSNTKFCYYNNYSLSQPRHFCKACKRYWTRGGTLRNVPVGGGCRKNKRLKRPTSATATATVTASTTAATHSSTSPAPDSTSSSSTSCANNNANPLHNQHNIFYGSTTSDLNVPFSGYDHHHLQPHLNALGLGFSSPNIDHRDFNLNGFNSSSLLSGYSCLFGNPSSSSISSLLASSKFTNGVGFKSADPSLFENLGSPPFGHHHQEVHAMGSNGGDQLGLNMKDVKLEDGMKRLDWNQQNQTDEIVAQSNDPNTLYANWSTQTWHDPTNLGSSITSSLI